MGLDALHQLLKDINAVSADARLIQSHAKKPGLNICACATSISSESSLLTLSCLHSQYECTSHGGVERRD